MLVLGSTSVEEEDVSTKCTDDSAVEPVLSSLTAATAPPEEEIVVEDLEDVDGAGARALLHVARGPAEAVEVHA